MRIKQAPDDFRVFEELRFEEDPHGPHHVHLVTKRKLSTLEAIDRIARQADVPRGAIAYAGLKDRQAVSRQYVSIEGQRIAIHEPDLQVEFVGRSAAKVTSKLSTGNRFEIVVRDVRPESLARLRRNKSGVALAGLPNYFDDQRFGSIAFGQGFVVRSLARGDAERALRQLIATPPQAERGGDVRLRQLLRDHWRDWEACASIARGPMYAAIFGRLLQDPRDFVGALNVVPTRLKLIHLFSYQSWLWNRGVSLWLQRRLRSREQLRLRTLSGRLVCWRYLSDEGRLALADKTLPLIDHETTYEDPDFGQAMAEVLAEEDITQRQLGLLRVAGFRLREEPRAVVLRPDDLEVSAPSADERNRGRLKVEIRFRLPRGAYATLVVKRLFTAPVRYGDEGDEAETERPARRGRPLRRAPGRPTHAPAKRQGRWLPQGQGPRRQPAGQPRRPAVQPPPRAEAAPAAPAEPKPAVAKPTTEAANYAQEAGPSLRPKRRTSVVRRLLRDRGDEAS